MKSLFGDFDTLLALFDIGIGFTWTRPKGLNYRFTCCNNIRFTFGRSAMYPKRSRPIPEVMPMHMIGSFPSESLNTVSTNFPMWTYGTKYLKRYITFSFDQTRSCHLILVTLSAFASFCCFLRRWLELQAPCVTRLLRNTFSFATVRVNRHIASFQANWLAKFNRQCLDCLNVKHEQIDNRKKRFNNKIRTKPPSWRLLFALRRKRSYVLR